MVGFGAKMCSDDNRHVCRTTKLLSEPFEVVMLVVGFSPKLTAAYDDTPPEVTDMGNGFQDGRTVEQRGFGYSADFEYFRKYLAG
jgi:hypothetical protein